MKRRTWMILAGVAASLGALAAGGCRGNPIVSSPPKIEVSLDDDGGAVVQSFDALLDGGLSFGDVPVLTPSVQTLTVSNLGTGTLDIFEVSVSPDGGTFSLPGAPLTSVGGSSSAPLTVQFDATQKATFAGALLITSDDQTNPAITIPLTGTGSTAAALCITPNPLDFGPVGQGQTVLATVTLGSCGTAPLLITGLAFGSGSDPAITLLSSSTLPPGGESIAIGDSIPLRFAFSPSAKTTADATGTYLIESSDPNQQPAAIVQLQGETILAPVAVISGAQTVAQGDTTILDGGGSYDPNQPPLTPLTYLWEIQSKPEDSTLTLTPSELVNPTLQVTLDAVGHYKFGLQVTNTAGVASDWTYYDVYARPTDDLYIEMIWDPATASSSPSPLDMDLNLLIDGGVAGGDGDCNAYVPDAGFGCDPGSDHLVGPGPEWIGVPIPPDGDYQVECKLSDTKNATSFDTIVTVRVYVYGVLATQVCQEITSFPETWDAVTIAWPSGTVTPIANTITCPETN